MRLIYLGSPDAAVAPLDALVGAGHDVRLVVSQPDRRRGRGSATSPSPVKARAMELGLTVTDDVLDVLDLAHGGAELGVVVAYGRLIRQPLLDVLPFVNLHFSLLPRWRGAAPVERAILAGDRVTGVCLMKLEAGLDTGPIYRVETTPIGPEETAYALRGRLVAIGSAMLVDALGNGLEGLGEPHEQQGDPTYAAKLDPAEFRLDWNRPADELARIVRIGLAWTTFQGRRLRLLGATVVADASDGQRISQTAPFSAGEVIGDLRAGEVVVMTGLGRLALRQVQPDGRAAMDASAWFRGVRPAFGDRFGV